MDRITNREVVESMIDRKLTNLYESMYLPKKQILLNMIPQDPLVSMFTKKYIDKFNEVEQSYLKMIADIETQMLDDVFTNETISIEDGMLQLDEKLNDLLGSLLEKVGLPKGAVQLGLPLLLGQSMMSSV